MFLDKIINSTKKRVETSKLAYSLEDLKEEVSKLAEKEEFAFEKALKGKDISFICEIKKASPSKGVIAEDFPYLEIAREYEKIGAAAVSVLTEPEFFMGSGKYLKEISSEIKIPTLRKDFIIDEYQIYEAKTLGASAVLLISEILSEDTLKNYIKIADSLGLSALVESHSYEEMQKALSAGARVIGINNRNLDTFKVDITTSVKLREFVPEDKIFVSESGISTPEDIKILKENNVNAVLIGETLMRSGNKKQTIENLRSLL